MCHAYELELVRRQYAREIARRRRQEAEESLRPDTPPAHPETAPPGGPEPVPA